MSLQVLKKINLKSFIVRIAYHVIRQVYPINICNVPRDKQ